MESSQVRSYPAKLDGRDRIRVDSVIIRKNWRTKDYIIRQELGVNPGDSVTTEELDKAVSRIWNIGNFAGVSYRLDTLEDSRMVLVIAAHDALTVMPDFSFSGNRKEFSLSAGVNDENFLGRNIVLNLEGTFGTLNKEAIVKLGIPRQLLYKNMTLRAVYTYGAEQKLKYYGGKPHSGVAYMKRNFYLTVGNPFHTDYQYTFSPDITLEYLSHKTDSSLFRKKIIHPDLYTVKYIGITLYESIGLVNQVRHQHNGALAGITAGYHFGLDKASPDYYAVSITGQVYKLFNRWIELLGTFSSGVTNARLSSQLRYIGPDLVKGSLTGERWGKGYISGGVRAGFTYINRNWFALEHAFFVYMGNAAGKYTELFNSKPLISAGTGVKLMIPMVPWLAVSIIYAYKGKGNQWFGIE